MNTVLYFLEQSGTSRYYDGLFRYFQNHSRNAYHVLSLRPADAFFAQIRDRVSRTSSLGKCSRYYTAIGAMAASLRESRPDLVHAHETIPAFYASLALMLSRSRAKLVYHRHHGRTRGLKMKLFDWVATSKATRIVAVSRAMSEIAAREHPRAKEKITFVHNGIDIGQESPKSAPALPGRGPRILLLGRLRPEKGHLVALDAIELVRRRFPDAMLVFAGAGSLEVELRREIETRRLGDAVALVGHVEDIPGLMSQVELVIAPSLTESFGLAAIEAMAARRLVIASRVGGLPEIIEDGSSGVLVEPSEPEELARRVVHYLEYPEERERLAEAGHRSYVERFSAEAMARSYLALYQELIGAS